MQNDIDDTLEHMLFLARRLNGCDVQYIVALILLELNIPVHYDGYEYLRRSIVLAYADSHQKMTKEIYPTVARQCGTYVNGSQVERAIRHAIEEAWRRRNHEMWRRYFSVDSAGEIKRPSNSEFIARVTAALDLWEGCCKLCGTSGRKEEL